MDVISASRTFSLLRSVTKAYAITQDNDNYSPFPNGDVFYIQSFDGPRSISMKDCSQKITVQKIVTFKAQKENIF